jgi:integrase
VRVKHERYDMATFQRRKRADGKIAWIAWVRVRPFKPVSRSFTTKAEAIDWADAHERELRAQVRTGVRHDVTRLTMRELIAEHLDDPETKALRTYEGHAALLAWWQNEYASERVLDWNVLKAREARAKLQRGRAPATVNRYLGALRSCWNWGRAAGLVPQERAWPSRLLLTEPKGRTRFLSDAELDELLRVASEYSPAMRAALLVSIACGLRQGELRRLRWGDIDFERSRLRVLLSKNNEARSVYLPGAAAEALRELRRAPIVGQHIFSDKNGQPVTKDWLEYRWRDLRTTAKLHDFRWHDLRHSCASFLAQQGANLLEIGSVLGHKSPSVTRRYAHLVEGAPVTGHGKLDEKLRGGR